MARYITISQAAAAMGMSRQRVQQLCVKGQIVGAVQIGGPGGAWAIPMKIKRIRGKSGPKPRH